MNPNTGELHSPEELDKMFKELGEDQFKEQTKDFIPVDKEDFTRDQLAKMMVSKHDSRSKLGKVRVEAMSKINNKKRKAKRRASRKSRKNNR